MMQYTKPAIIDRKLRILQEAVFDNELTLPVWRTRKGMYLGQNRYENVEPNWSEISVGDSWQCCADMTRWFTASVTVPQEFAGKRLALELEFGGEAIVRVNGEIRCSVTAYQHGHMTSAARSRVLLSECAVAGTVYEVELEAQCNYLEFCYFGGGAKSVEPVYDTYYIRKASLVTVNLEAERYYFDLLTANDALRVLRNPLDAVTRCPKNLSGEVTSLFEQGGKDPYYYEKVADAVICSVSRLDFDLGREALLASIKPAAETLQSKLAAIRYQPHAAVRFVGQSHIDTAWLWPLRESERKCAKTLSNVCDLMDRYPDFVFAFSQPQLFAYTKENYPEVYERVKEKVSAGKLEPVGNTWVEMDANIPSGESLVRQLLYGRQFFLKEFGKASEIFWMPDVFGYSWALPQIIKRSGMKYFFTSKLNNNDDTRFPHSLFSWQGIDGTRITAYLQRLNYNGVICPNTLQTLYNRFDEKSLSDTSLMTFGYGDGGGGPSYQMLETAKRLEHFPGLPALEIGSAQSFFEQTDALAEQLPVWNDEMYYEFHRGTYTSQADVKKNNRKCELLLRGAEMACALAKVFCGSEYPYAELQEAYEKLLTNQFHDIIPGSSVHSVYVDAARHYREIRQTGEALQNAALSALCAQIAHEKDSVIVFNFLSWERGAAVEVEAPEEYAAPAVEGVESSVIERDGKRFVVFHAVLPAMGWRCYRLIDRPAQPVTSTVTVSKNLLENRFWRIVLDENAVITSVWDKRCAREVLCGKGNLLKIFEDKPSHETAWNIDLEYQNKCWALERADSIEVAEQSAVRSVLRVKRSFHQSAFEQDIVLYADSPRIDFVNRADWNETEKMLKTEFNVDVLAGRASYEIQFGTIERSTHTNTIYDRTKFEACGHKWADLSEGSYGVALLNDCKYGYDISDRQMRLTLLRASTDPDPVADRGHHEFTYSLLPHAGNRVQANVVAAGYELNVPPVCVLCRDEAASGRALSGCLSCDNDNVVIDTVKCAEDGEGIIVRVYESSGTKTNAVLHLALPADTVTETDLMEQNESRIACENGRLEFVIKPYEIKTFRLN